MHGKDAKGARRPDNVLLRVFCHAHGSKVVLLLNGYDKIADPRSRVDSDADKSEEGGRAHGGVMT